MIATFRRTLWIGALLGAAMAWMAIARAQSTPAYRDGFIIVEGRKIHYLDWGPAGKSAFLLIHALGHSAHSRDHVAPQLNQRYRVIAIDLRGHGDSDWSPKGDYDVKSYVADVHALVEQLKLT